uniref:Ubiquitin carboxyl-terminal hydrolase n=1 Tax=Heterorhabditis bacteriophora TaxID=37862 RepID=A0A1I7WML5_HETBA
MAEDAVGNMTYNELVERVCDDQSSDRVLLEEFLNSSMTQLTYYGLFRLMDTMRDNELAVLFRNNHFHTMLKRKDELFLLVSDSGYLKVPNVVWETLNNVEGNSVFVNSEFNSIVDETPSLSDYLLARKLQNEEQELALRERQDIVKNRVAAADRPLDAPLLLSNEIQNNTRRVHGNTFGHRDNATTPKEKKNRYCWFEHF